MKLLSGIVVCAQAAFLAWLIFCMRSGNIFAELGFLFAVLVFTGIDVIAWMLYQSWKAINSITFSGLGF